MKVLYFMNHVGTGGAALALYDLIVALKTMHPHDYHPVVITGKKNQLNEALTKISVENYSAPFKNFLTSARKPAFLFRFILQLRYILTRHFAIKQIEKLIDFKTIDIIHSNLNRIDIGYYFAKKYTIPHTWHIREHGYKDFTTTVFPFYNPLFSDANSKFIAISKSVKSFWSSEGIPENNIEMIYDGVNSINWSHEKKINKLPQLSFIFLGGYDVNKGQKIFIEALKLLPPEIKDHIIVHFYGNGSKKYRQSIAILLNKYELDNCCTLFDYEPNIYSILETYHIGVNCSKHEGFGRVTVEYMMAGLCPLVSNCTANVEIVEDKNSGLVFDRNNLADLKEKIIYLFNHRESINQLSANAKKMANDSFSITNHATSIYKLYRKLVK